MSARVLQKPEVKSVKVIRLGGPGPELVQPRAEAPAFAEESKSTAEAPAGKRSFFKGLIAGIALELAAAASIYLIWQLWHDLR